MSTRAKDRETKKKKRRRRGPEADSVPATPAPHDSVPQPGRPEPGIYPINPAGPLTRLYAWIIDVGLLILILAMLNTATGGRFASPSAAPQDIIIFLAYFIIPTGIWGRDSWQVGGWYRRSGPRRPNSGRCRGHPAGDCRQGGVVRRPRLRLRMDPVRRETPRLA